MVDYERHRKIIEAAHALEEHWRDLCRSEDVDEWDRERARLEREFDEEMDRRRFISEEEREQYKEKYGEDT